MDKKISFRGMPDLGLLNGNLSNRGKEDIRKALLNQKLGFNFSCVEESYQLHAVDRFALYPLFYVHENGQFKVSSRVDDLLPLLSHKILHPIGYYSTGGLLKGGRSPFSPFKGIMRIPPGHFLEYKNHQVEITKYWSFGDLSGKPFEGTYEEACDTLGLLIKQAVERCYAYDNNLAAHLSGGLDSGSIVALLAQKKMNPIQTYVHVNSDAPDIAPPDQPFLENTFIRQYQRYYPHIAVNKSYALPFDLPHSIAPVQPSGNWHHVDHHSPEGKICQDMNKKEIKYILSGVGGDELASYGHGHQSSNQVVHNDRELKRFLYQNIFLQRRVKNLIRGILGMEGPRLDAMASTFVSRPLHKGYLDYHPQFRSQVPALEKYEQIALYWSPSSFDYRLELLDRSYLSVRADKWNYLSQYYNIDYVFPLLEADLIEFCASLPREFFIGKPQRNMFKRGLSPFIPKDLLLGGKRPGYAPNNNEKPINYNLQDTIDKLNQLKSSLAAQVFDFKYLMEKISNLDGKLKRIPKNWVKTRKRLLREADYHSVFLEIDYINANFDDILK